MLDYTSTLITTAHAAHVLELFEQRIAVRLTVGGVVATDVVVATTGSTPSAPTTSRSAATLHRLRRNHGERSGKVYVMFSGSGRESRRRTLSIYI